MGTYLGAVRELALTIQKIAGIRSAPESAPDNASMFPFVAVQPASGIYRGLNRDQMIGLHNIAIELHVKRYELDRSQDNLKALMDEIPGRCTLKLQNSEYQNISTWERIDYTAMPLEWAGVPTLGAVYMFINVKIITDISE